jgi:CHAT domain
MDLPGENPLIRKCLRVSRTTRLSAPSIHVFRFIQAGAQNLLMTLWPISDEVTVQIMSDFYDAAHNSGNAPEALAEVQRNWLLKLRTEKGLAQAVNLAGPFIMSSQGKP